MNGIIISQSIYTVLSFLPKLIPLQLTTETNLTPENVSGLMQLFLDHVKCNKRLVLFDLLLCYLL